MWLYREALREWFLAPETTQALAAVTRADRNQVVIPGKIKAEAMRNLNDPREIVCERGGLENLRIHDGQRSGASRALSLGGPFRQSVACMTTRR